MCGGEWDTFIIPYTLISRIGLSARFDYDCCCSERIEIIILKNIDTVEKPKLYYNTTKYLYIVTTSDKTLTQLRIK